MSNNVMIVGKTERVEKEWGYEEILVNTPLYCLKKLHIVYGYQCSIHHHNKKDETFFVDCGTVGLVIGFRLDCLYRYRLLTNSSIYVLPGLWHRFGGLDEYNMMLEVSTQDSVEDNYRWVKELSGSFDPDEFKHAPTLGAGRWIFEGNGDFEGRIRFSRD